MKKKAAPRKKTAAGKFAAAVKAAAKKAVSKKSVAKKAAPSHAPVKKVPETLAAPAAVKHGPLHLPSRPEPAYSVMHRRDWAHQPPPHKIPIPKR